MELLAPTHPPHRHPAREPASGFSPPAAFRQRVAHPTSFRPAEIAEEGVGGEKAEICVAVGKRVDKAVSLLHWTFRRFGCKDICILHVHQPSPQIPTLLGKLPASQANPEFVSAYRREEKEQMKKLLEKYLSVCRRTKVNASIITIEADQVHKGIVELVTRHSVRKLVMGAATDNCMRVKQSSNKATYASKNAPPFCEIWFVNKGKHLWTREASSDSISLPPFGQGEAPSAMMSRSRTLQHNNSNSSIHLESFQFSSTTSVDCIDVTSDCIDVTSWAHGKAILPLPCNLSSSSCRYLTHHCQSSVSNTSSECTSDETTMPSESGSKTGEDSPCNQLREATTEAETSHKETCTLLECRKLELESLEAIKKIQLLESTHAREVKLRREAEEALRTTMHEQEKLEEENDEMTRELQKTMENVALLDNRVQEGSRRHDEAAGELKLIQASIATLRQEKQNIQRQKMEAVRWLDRWRSRGQTRPADCNGIVGFVEDLPELAEFSLADLQTATCNFSESFKIGKGGYGCVYKGEMLGRTVAIKKLYPLNIQGQSEFQQEVQVLSRLQHPHLVTLLGVCPEAWSLVYEYLPNGSLHDRLFRKSNVSLSWKTRARIIAEISSALCFLHSSKPEKIVHGDLKPENILLDSDLSCKICDFGICRLVTEDTLHCPSFRRSTDPKGAFPYADPEFHRMGVMTPKSDIYAFGLIMLQLLTGKPPVGLAGEVRKAVSYGKLGAILDSSAGEWPMFVAQHLADLGLQCCETYGRDRPDLKPSLVRELEQLHVSEERPVPSFFLCPILQEIMHDPQVAADGFTYEGEAMRKWIGNGGGTSPMTNLKLSHLHLTPNHALRIAIQDWLCRS